MTPCSRQRVAVLLAASPKLPTCLPPPARSPAPVPSLTSQQQAHWLPGTPLREASTVLPLPCPALAPSGPASLLPPSFALACLGSSGASRSLCTISHQRVQWLLAGAGQQQWLRCKEVVSELTSRVLVSKCGENSSQQTRSTMRWYKKQQERTMFTCLSKDYNTHALQSMVAVSHNRVKAAFLLQHLLHLI